MDDPVGANLVVGWLWMLGGIAAGGVVGLFFYKEDWLGGYASFRRRLVRLAHISFFGLGFLNLLYALTTGFISVAEPYRSVASICLIVGAITMPLCCYLTAWRTRFRHLFPVPVLATAAAIVSLLIGGELI